jgi:hypothetical protein
MNDMIQTVVADPGVRNAVLFTAAALAGQAIHGIKKWTAGEEWMFANLKRTVAAVIANLTAVVAAIQLGLDNLTLSQLLAAGVTLGLSADTLVNKGVRKPWSEDQREAKSAIPPS